mmetsp:Transcript_26412/g.48316  ORF Transcript_26412/g.48316 Transcript_26412/m.48316 type:complete len:643 (-) Transcript_26412:32-1960(-)
MRGVKALRAGVTVGAMHVLFRHVLLTGQLGQVPSHFGRITPPPKLLPRVRTAATGPLQQVGTSFRNLADTLERCSQLSGNIEKTESLTAFFERAARAGASHLEAAYRLAKIELAPPSDNFKLGVGKAMVEAALNELMPDFLEVGTLASEALSRGDAVDLADAAQQVLKHIQPERLSEEHLSCGEVLDGLKNIGNMSGKGSRQRRREALADLFKRAYDPDSFELMLLIRICMGELRVGIGKATVDTSMSALGAASAELQEANAAAGSSAAMIKSMLAKPSSSFTELAESAQEGEWLAEWKYDGERVQIHLERDSPPQFFSRQGKSTTEKYSDLAEQFQTSLANAWPSGVQKAVLDGELMAYNPENPTEELPFRTLSTRKEALKPGERAAVQVRVRLFDCLQYGEEDLVNNATLATRRERLQELLACVVGDDEQRITLAESRVIGGGAAADAWQDIFLEAVHTGGAEGIIAKDLQSVYRPGSRSMWRKAKKNLETGRLADTIDAVVVGVRRGQGNRSETFGSLLLALPDTEDLDAGKQPVLKPVCFAGTGLTEAGRQQAFEWIKDHLLPERPGDVAEDSTDPDYWLHPDARFVWELSAQEITESDVYASSYSLRFPVLCRHRDDKGVDEATTLQQLAELACSTE